MPLWKKVARYIGGFLLLILFVGLFLPSTAHVERQIKIEAPVASIFALVNDFRRMNEWSPWMEADPNALFQISGPPRGVGATISWDGRTIGQGSQTIIESEPWARIVNQIDLGGDGDTTSTFEFVQMESGSIVVWSFDNHFDWNLIGRYFGLMLDGIVGPDYERGLESLKIMAERLPNADFSGVEIEHRTVDALDIAYLSTGSVPEARAISEALGEAYFKLLNYIDKNKLQAAGSPMSISGEFDGSQLKFDAAIPIRGLNSNPPAAGSGVKIGRSYGGRVLRVKHVGAYRTLGRTHDKIGAYLAALGLERNGEAWESYTTDPTRVPEDELLTYVYYPIKDDG